MRPFAVTCVLLLAAAPLFSQNYYVPDRPNSTPYYKQAGANYICATVEGSGCPTGTGGYDWLVEWDVDGDGNPEVSGYSTVCLQVFTTQEFAVRVRCGPGAVNPGATTPWVSGQIDVADEINLQGIDLSGIRFFFACTSITAGGVAPVRVLPGAMVIFDAPRLALGSGFSVANGAKFTATYQP